MNVTTTNSACGWTASGLSATPTSGTGNGTVTFTIPPNGTVNTLTLTSSVSTKRRQRLTVYGDAERRLLQSDTRRHQRDRRLIGRRRVGFRKYPGRV